MKPILETELSGCPNNIKPGSRYAVDVGRTNNIPAYERNNNTASHHTMKSDPDEADNAPFFEKQNKESATKSKYNTENSDRPCISYKKRLPSGFGTIRYLGKGRKNTYAVHPPLEVTGNSSWIRPPALCYVSDWGTGFKVLSLYHAGFYEKKLDRDPAALESRFSGMLSELGLAAEQCTDGGIWLKKDTGASPSGFKADESPYLTYLFLKKIHLVYDGESYQKEEVHKNLANTPDQCCKNAVHNTIRFSGTENGLQVNDGTSFIKDRSLSARPAAIPHSDYGNHPAENMNPPGTAEGAFPLDSQISEPANAAAIANELDLNDAVKQGNTGDETYTKLFQNIYSCYGRIMQKLEHDHTVPAGQKGNPIQEILLGHILMQKKILESAAREGCPPNTAAVFSDLGTVSNKTTLGGSATSEKAELLTTPAQFADPISERAKSLTTQAPLTHPTSAKSGLLTAQAPLTHPTSAKSGLLTAQVPFADLSSEKEKIYYPQNDLAAYTQPRGGSLPGDLDFTPNTRMPAAPTQGIPAAYLQTQRSSGQINKMPVLRDVYLAFFDFKYGDSAAKQLSRSSRNASASACRKLTPLFDRTLDEISVIELQDLVNRNAAAGYSRSAISDLVTLIRQLYRFAYPREMCTKEYGRYIIMPFTLEEVHHQDFTDEELKILWLHQNNPVVRMILIMCYSGFRIGEFAPENGMKTVISADGTTGYFQGGIKTKAGKHRVVPIHSAILPLVKKVINKQGEAVYLCGKSMNRFRDDMKSVLVDLKIDSPRFNTVSPKTSKNTSENTGGGTLENIGKNADRIIAGKMDENTDKIIAGKIGDTTDKIIAGKIGDTTDKIIAGKIGDNNDEIIAGKMGENTDKIIAGKTGEKARKKRNEKTGGNADQRADENIGGNPVGYADDNTEDNACAPPASAGDQLTSTQNVRYHTPHSCRHTFSRLCESYGVNEADRKRMLGHAFGNDITNGVYGHRSTEELSAEIEKIRVP